MVSAFLRMVFGRGAFAGFLFLALAPRLSAQTDQPIYTDSLQNAWQNYGWTLINYNNSSPVHLGAASISVTITQAWQAIYIAHNSFDSSPYTNITFWLHGGTSGGQQLQLQGHSSGNPDAAVTLTPPVANTWALYSIPLSSIVTNRATMDGFWIQVMVNPQPTFYLDDITLVAGTTPVVTLTSPPNGASYIVPATINLAASVLTNSHTINQVQFYNGASLLSSQTVSPYRFTWTGMGTGTYTLSARLIYDTTNNVDSAAATVTVATPTPATITLDAQLNRHPINPLIYGTAFASSNQLKDLNFTMNRSGGNEETTYNWQLNTHGKGADWYFESYPDASATPGQSADSFVNDSKGGGVPAMITLPMIGWMPKVGPGRSIIWSYSVAKYGPQTGSDPSRTDAGNGLSSTNGNKPITWNDPNDANFPTNTAFTQSYVQHLMSRWGSSTNGGVPYYILDNEHSIWHSTHQDIHPIGATMQEIWTQSLATASMVKSNDPNALVAGPEEWGWNGYFYSGYDQQWSGQRGDYNPAHYPDRQTNGGWDYMPWLLNQFHQHDTSTGKRLLDYFTLHCYPQEANVGGNDVSPATVQLRNQSTRQFWDTNYVDPSWINSIIKLIPRMKSWVATYYPGTKIGITEYNWGAESDISGATAQADILGIFGREGLDLATRWTTPGTGTPTYKAMKMFRNYDGLRSGFGDTSINATGPNPDNIAAFASLRSSDGALTLVVINKQLSISAAAAVTITNRLLSGTGQVWQLTSANTITHLSDISFGGTTFTSTVPPQSITMFVLPQGTTPPPPQLRAGSMSQTNTFDLWLDGTVGQRYILLSSADLATWQPVQTNTLSSSSWHIIVPASNRQNFYRGLWSP
jgi:hypothetical protein